jgi:hypothetical protein
MKTIALNKTINDLSRVHRSLDAVTADEVVRKSVDAQFTDPADCLDTLATLVEEGLELDPDFAAQIVATVRAAVRVGIEERTAEVNANRVSAANKRAEKRAANA